MLNPKPTRGHRLVLGDATLGAADALGPADLVYTDPPWGQGNLTYWRRAAGLDRASWGEFPRRLASLVASACRGPILIEMGVRWADEMDAAMAALGVRPEGRHVMTYGRPPRPNVLLGYQGADVSGLPGEGWAATREVARRHAVPGGVLLDPCVGLGRSAAIFARAGMVVHGCEINPDRLARAAKRLGAEPC